jgi:hypothetical protein
LQDGYPDGGAAGTTATNTNYDDGSAPANVPIDGDVKAAIASQISYVLNSSGSAQGNVAEPLPAALDPKVQVFIVASAMRAPKGDQFCNLTTGDILKLPHPAADGAAAADLTVIGTKAGDCPKGAQVNVSIKDLQNMHNQFLAHADDGTRTLAGKQGTGGIPKAPPGTGAPVPNPDAQPFQPPDGPALDAELGEQQSHAADAERQAQQDAQSGN